MYEIKRGMFLFSRLLGFFSLWRFRKNQKKLLSSPFLRGMRAEIVFTRHSGPEEEEEMGYD